MTKGVLEIHKTDPCSYGNESLGLLTQKLAKIWPL